MKSALSDLSAGGKTGHKRELNNISFNHQNVKQQWKKQ
jgi:hypothetical protein